MIEHDLEDTEKEETETAPNGGAEEGRRTGRSLKNRPKQRSLTLRRKKLVQPAVDQAKTPSAAKTKPAVTKKRVAKPAKPRAAAIRTPPRRKAPPREEKFEIRSLPDGTQFKVKISEKKKAARSIPRRKRSGDSGPGPAVTSLESPALPFEDTAKKISLGSIVEDTRRATAYLKRRLSVQPKVGVVLGSGLSSVAELISEEPAPFSRIPGFAPPTVAGHSGRVRAGMVENVAALICEGRLHYYETGSMEETVRPVQTFMALGVEHLIFTTAAGALNPVYRTGDVMFVKDHINLMGDNPMFGLDPNAEPSPFVDVSSVYDESVIEISERLCRRVRIRRQIGVLAGMRGPVYETPAERAWLSSIGADAVCMSVIPEALAAARAGVRVTALALIVNDSASMKSHALAHENVVNTGKTHAANMKRLIKGLLTSL